jgi:formylglycine-generating enzyme required for sulfatase activity
MRRLELVLKLAVLGIALLPLGCSSCSSGHANGDGGTDTDTDTDSDTHIEFDGGPTTPCENEPLDDEVCIPGGKYVMGCMPGDVECTDEEKPMVEVTLSPFFVDVREITYEQLIPWLNTLYDGYERGVGWIRSEEGPPYTIIWQCRGAPVLADIPGNLFRWYEMGETLPDGVDDANFCFNRDPDMAANGLGWWGAKLYCESLGKSLPTEAQWEAAARGQTLNEYPCGSDFEPCWYGPYDCMLGGDCAWELCFDPCGIPFTGHYDEGMGCWSPTGVADMLGNASEWVLDWMNDGDDHSACADGCSDPGPTGGAKPILKGGGVVTGSEDIRISARYRLNDDSGNQGTGFRCVRRDEPYAPPDSGTDGGK